MNGANELAQWLTAQITVQMSSNVLWMDGDGICGILTTATVFLTITSRLDRTFSQPVVAWLWTKLYIRVYFFSNDMNSDR